MKLLVCGVLMSLRVRLTSLTTASTDDHHIRAVPMFLGSLAISCLALLAKKSRSISPRIAFSSMVPCSAIKERGTWIHASERVDARALSAVHESASERCCDVRWRVVFCADTPYGQRRSCIADLMDGFADAFDLPVITNAVEASRLYAAHASLSVTRYEHESCPSGND